MSATKDLVRELNNALTEAETQGMREVYWGFQEQREALFNHNFKSFATCPDARSLDGRGLVPVGRTL